MKGLRFRYRIGRRIQKKLEILFKQRRKFKATTHSKHTLSVAENLLYQQSEAKRPTEVCLIDITCILTEEGWLYLAGHKDIGYVMGSRITKNLVSQSLFRALVAKWLETSLIRH